MEHWKNLSLEVLSEVYKGELVIEEWRPVVGYEGSYEISTFGRVKGYGRKNKKDKTKILKQNLKPTGYLYVELHKELKQSSKRVHRLVMIAFVENPENKPYVNHKDCNKSNNNLRNIEWSTIKENAEHAKENGLYKPAPCRWKGKFGKDHFASKKIAQLNLDGELIKVFYGQQEAERETGVYQANIWKVLNGKRVTAGNYKWKYI